MATFTKQFFSSSYSGSFYGLPIEVLTSGTYPAAPFFGTGIHTFPSGSTEIDEVWLYATNVSTGSQTLVVQFGNSGSAYEIVQELPSRAGLTLIVPGLVMGQTSSLSPPLADGAHIAAYVGGPSDSATSDVLISGYVNRISGSGL